MFFLVFFSCVLLCSLQKQPPIETKRKTLPLSFESECSFSKSWCKFFETFTDNYFLGTFLFENLKNNNVENELLLCCLFKAYCKLCSGYQSQKFFWIQIWVKVLRNGTSKICGGQPLKNFGPFLNTLSHTSIRFFKWYEINLN